MPYYNVRIKDIPEGGRDLSASFDRDEWFKKLLIDALDEFDALTDAKLLAKMARADKSVDITGGIYIKLNVLCSRCMEEFELNEQIPFRFLLEPEPKKSPKKDENEDNSESLDDSLDFSYYSTEEVDVGDLIRQHVVIAQPINHVCDEDCKGLCPKCGKNLNEGECNCKEDVSDSPFSVLKKLKPH